MKKKLAAAYSLRSAEQLPPPHTLPHSIAWTWRFVCFFLLGFRIGRGIGVLELYHFHLRGETAFSGDLGAGCTGRMIYPSSSWQQLPLSMARANNNLASSYIQDQNPNKTGKSYFILHNHSGALSLVGEAFHKTKRQTAGLRVLPSFQNSSS